MTEPSRSNQQPSPRTIEQRRLVATCVALGVALMICVALLAFRGSGTHIVTRNRPAASARLCPANRQHNQCVERIITEKLSYLGYYFKGIWGIKAEGDQPFVTYRQNIEKTVKVCEQDVLLYHGRVVMLGQTQCGPPPVPLPEGEGEPA